MVEVANAYAEGNGLPRNLNAAFKWYTKAAEGGDRESKVKIKIIRDVKMIRHVLMQNQYVDCRSDEIDSVIFGYNGMSRYKAKQCVESLLKDLNMSFTKEYSQCCFYPVIKYTASTRYAECTIIYFYQKPNTSYLTPKSDRWPCRVLVSVGELDRRIRFWDSEKQQEVSE